MTQKETYAPHHCLNESSYKVAKMNLVIGMEVPNVSGAWCFLAMLPWYMGMVAFFIVEEFEVALI